MTTEPKHACPECGRTVTHLDGCSLIGTWSPGDPIPSTEPKHGLKRYDLNKLLGVMLEYDDGYYVLASEADALIAAKDAEIAGLRKSLEPKETYAVFGWAIEGAWSPTDNPEYWLGSSAWSTDPNKSIRFATQKSAKQAADLMCSGLNIRICSHEWVESSETMTDDAARSKQEKRDE